jgi:carboxyl-terminal processing protease
MGFRRIFVTFLLLITCVIYAKPPELTPKDAKKKIEEILRAHVTHKTLNPEIIKRSLNNFLDELDPTKTYLIDNEVVAWSSPSTTLLEAIERDFKNESFSQFEKMYDTMVQAILRRGLLEKELENTPLPTGISAETFKDLQWAKTHEELKQRILALRALQLEAADNFDGETKEQFLQKLSKRRLNREQEINLPSKTERQGQVLSYTLKSITASLDAHTSYFTPSEASQFMIQVQQRLFGIGAQLRDNLNGFSIVKLIEGSPAFLSNKLKVGDRIIAVNNEPIVGLDIVEAVDLIRGPQGSKVNLTILRESTESENKSIDKFDIEIIRDEIILKETRFETNLEPYGDGVIAHIHLFSFYQDPKSSSTKDLREAIEKIKKEHQLLGVILDLRNNAGGILPQAVSVTGLFISKGIVASIKDHTGKIQHLRHFDGEVAWDGPLLVLTNRASASAAEIVAQALQDYGRAIIIGDDHTYGKGSYQSFTLESANAQKINPQGEYKVTRGIYYTVSGKSPQLNGAKADIIVPGVLSYLDIGESFSKYALESDQIKPNFEDDLSDIHPLHKGKMKRLYKNNLQPVLDFYKPYLPVLNQNSAKRLAINQNYQNFLTEIQKTNPSYETMEIFGQNDLQLEETFNVMKDLIYMIRESSSLAKENIKPPLSLAL